MESRESKGREEMKDKKLSLPFLKDGIAEPLGGRQLPYFQLPTSNISAMINEVLSMGSDTSASRKDGAAKKIGTDLATLAERKTAIGKGRKVYTAKAGSGHKVILLAETPQGEELIAEFSVGFTDIRKLAGANKETKKLFNYILIKSNEQGLTNSPSFLLSDLVDAGLYKNERTAKKGVDIALRKLLGLTLTIKGDGKDLDLKAERSLFTGWARDKGRVVVELNKDININILGKYWTPLPRYSFSLPARAFGLLEYIVYRARQECKPIAENGSFKITFRTIQKQLNLPKETDCKNPERDIRQPLIKAVEAIKEADKGNGFNVEIVEPKNDEHYSIAKFLDKGYLQITPLSAYNNYYREIYSRKGTRIVQSAKRKETIVDHAKAINLAKKMNSGADV